MGRLLGIDYGSKRVGIAVSDPNRRIALPKAVLANDRYLVSTLEDMCREGDVEQIVLGESRDFSGQPNPIWHDAERFKSVIEQETKIPVVYEPEFMTSQQARQIQGRHDMHDASAAAIILQSYLDKAQNLNKE
jgi:putative Holliday junction resolvase